MIVETNWRPFVYAALVTIMSSAVAHATPPSTDADAVARENWRTSITDTPVPGEGCFMAEYPSTSWMPVGCVKATSRPFIPRRGASSDLVGNGHDYAASVASGVITKTVGSFPVVSGVTTEVGLEGANDYSLQLNSNFMTTAACNGISGCQSWEQFVYSSGEQQAFMQYWLIGYGATCPSKAWMSAEGTDCYRNSAAVTVPKLPITDLNTFRLVGSAVAKGKDTLIFTGESIAYSTTGLDSVVDLATDWEQSEFNVIGDGDGSAAAFNPGSKIQVWIHVYSGTTSAPTCAKNAGTTGETNNLTLGNCVTKGGTGPYILFVEKN